MTKEEVWKVIEARINTLQSLTIECVELIYNGAYNEAIEEAALAAEKYEAWAIAYEIRTLKK